jgi:salicylate hydroxylase
VAPGSSLKTLVDVDCSQFSSVYGASFFFAHRVDLHTELQRLAAGSGPGSPVEISLRSEVVNYAADQSSVTLSDGSVHHADLIVAADGVHTTAIHQVIGHAVPAVSTGSAAFRFLIPSDVLRKDSDIAPLLEDGALRVLVAEDRRRLVWYPCAEYDIPPCVTGFDSNNRCSATRYRTL